MKLRPQFSLRTTMVCAAVVAGAIAIGARGAREVRNWDRQRTALEKCGFDEATLVDVWGLRSPLTINKYEAPEWALGFVVQKLSNNFATDLSPERCAFLAELSDLQDVDLGHSSLAKQGAKDLGSLRHVRSLSLRACGYGDDEIVTLLAGDIAGSVESLNLSELNITDTVIEGLVKCSNLHTLDLERTQITTAGAVRVIRSLERLTALRLSGTGVSDEVFEDIAKAPGLSAVTVEDTQVTIEGCKRLRELRPSILIKCDYW